MNKIFFIVICMLLSNGIMAQKLIKIAPENGDMTPIIRAAIEGVKEKDIKIVLSKGVYKFKPNLAYGKFCSITNHENGYKNIIFPLQGFNSVEIEGNGAELIFSGQVLPFLFEECNKVTLSDITIDWDIPFLFQGEVIAVNEKEEWREIKPFTDGFSWSLKGGKVEFPNIDGFHFTSLGSTLPFTKIEKRVAHGGFDFTSKPEKVVKLLNGNLRIYEKMKHYPPIGTILNSKGPKGENRYAPAIHGISSSNLSFKGVVIHHALGMGFLLERCSDIDILDSGVYLSEGSNRVVSSIADATHFCNCKGEVLVENCRFENMLDDGTNVHGTYVAVSKIINDNTIQFKLSHFQQDGFKFAGEGDEIWFIHAPSPSRGSVSSVKRYKVINQEYGEISFDQDLPDGLKVGDILENKTWNPTFTMRGCTIRNHRARNIVLKTPLKTVIENNNLSSMMSSILFRGETFYWFESGAVEDVLIRNNHFNYCAYSGSEHAVLYITPRLGSGFDKTESYDKNIRFIDNTIETFDPRIVMADRAEGLVIKGNKITRTKAYRSIHPDAPVIDLTNCVGTEVINNIYSGECKQAIKGDKRSLESLTVKGNKGLK